MQRIALVVLGIGSLLLVSAPPAEAQGRPRARITVRTPRTTVRLPRARVRTRFRTRAPRVRFRAPRVRVPRARVRTRLRAPRIRVPRVRVPRVNVPRVRTPRIRVRSPLPPRPTTVIRTQPRVRVTTTVRSPTCDTAPRVVYPPASPLPPASTTVNLLAPGTSYSGATYSGTTYSGTGYARGSGVVIHRADGSVRVTGSTPRSSVVLPRVTGRSDQPRSGLRSTGRTRSPRSAYDSGRTPFPRATSVPAGPSLAERLLDALREDRLEEACRLARWAGQDPRREATLQRALFARFPSPTLLARVANQLDAGSRCQGSPGRDTLLRLVRASQG